MLVVPGGHVQGSPVPPCGFAPVANALLAFLLHCNQSPLLHQVVTHLDMVDSVENCNAFRPVDLICQSISKHISSKNYLLNQFKKYENTS